MPPKSYDRQFTDANGAGIPVTERRQRGSKRRGDHKSTGLGRGRVGEFQLEGTQERRTET